MKITKNTKRIKSPKRKSKSTTRVATKKPINTTSAIDTSGQEIIKDIHFWENEVRNEKELKALEVLCGLSDGASENLSLEYEPETEPASNDKKTTPVTHREADSFTHRMLLANTRPLRKVPERKEDNKTKAIVLHLKHHRKFVQENTGMSVRLKKELDLEKTPLESKSTSTRDIKESIDKVIEAYTGKEKHESLVQTKDLPREKINENVKLFYEEKPSAASNGYHPFIKRNDESPGRQKLKGNMPLHILQAPSKIAKFLRPKSLEKVREKEGAPGSLLSRQMALELIEKFENANKEKQDQLEDSNIDRTGRNRRPESRAKNIVELSLQKAESLNTYLDIKEKKQDYITKDTEGNRPQSNSSYRNKEKELTVPGINRVEDLWGRESPLRSLKKVKSHIKGSPEIKEKASLKIKSSFELPKNAREAYEGFSYDPKGIKIKPQSIIEKSIQHMQERTVTKVNLGSPQQKNLRKFLNQVTSHREFIKGEKMPISISAQKPIADNPEKKQDLNGLDSRDRVDSDRRLKLPETVKAFSGKANSRESTKYIKPLTYRGTSSVTGTETPLMARNYKEFTVAALHKIPKTQFMEAVGRKY